MTFAAPKILWLLLVVMPPLIYFFWWSWRKRQQLIAQFTSERLLGHLKVGVSPSRQKFRMVLISIAVLFLILALARPQWGVIREEVHQRGVDIIVAIDTSNSMLAEDVSPNRLTRAKLAALDLMRRAKTDRLGLIAFAGSAFLECPMTLDDSAFSQSVNSLDTQTISQGGTAISEAIDEARRTFKKESDNHKVLVIFSDGEDHEGDPVESAKEAASEGITIFTIGVGTADGELLRVRDERGRVDYIRNDQGQPVRSKMDETMLKEIARAGKGFELPLRGTKTIDSLYDQGIAPLPKTESAAKLFQRYHDRFQWPLVVAIALLICEIFLPDRKRRRSARPAAATTTMSAISETVAVLLLLAIPAVAWGSPSSALREYNDGNYKDAFKDYNKLLDKSDDPRLHFNAGAAAYQSRDLESAMKEFSAALTSPDLPMQQRSYYNLGNTLFRIGQQLPEADKKQEAWENAVKQYESALKLNTQDADAKYNQEFVKKQIELLKKQQQQQQSSDKSKQDKSKDQKNQDQKNQNQQNQENKDQNSQQQDKQNQQNQNSSGQKQDSQKDKQGNQSQEQSKQNQEKQKQQAQKDKEKADKQNQSQAANQAKDKSKEEAEQEAAAMAAGEMTQQQAQQLLDSQKDEEQVLRLAPTNNSTLQSRSFKNW